MFVYVKSEMNESTVQGSLLYDALPVIEVTVLSAVLWKKTKPNQNQNKNNKTTQEVNDKNTVTLNTL